jgi:hypothetical protein
VKPDDTPHSLGVIDGSASGFILIDVPQASAARGPRFNGDYKYRGNEVDVDWCWFQPYREITLQFPGKLLVSEGRRVLPDETPQSLGLKDGDVLYLYDVPPGGHQ